MQSLGFCGKGNPLIWQAWRSPFLWECQLHMCWNTALLTFTAPAPWSVWHPEGKNICRLSEWLSKRRNSVALNSNRKQVRVRKEWREGEKKRKMSQVCRADSPEADGDCSYLPTGPHHHLLLIQHPGWSISRSYSIFKTTGKDEILGRVFTKGAWGNVPGVRRVNWN